MQTIKGSPIDRDDIGATSQCGEYTNPGGNGGGDRGGDGGGDGGPSCGEAVVAVVGWLPLTEPVVDWSAVETVVGWLPLTEPVVVWSALVEAFVV